MFELNVEDIIAACVKLNIELNYDLAEIIFNRINSENINKIANKNYGFISEEDVNYYDKFSLKAKIAFNEIRKELKDNNFFNLI